LPHNFPGSNWSVHFVYFFIRRNVKAQGFLSPNTLACVSIIRMTGRNPAYITGEIKVSCCSKLGYRGNPGIKVNSNATVPLARSWSCRSWHYSTVMGAPMDLCRKQYIHLHLFKLYVRTVQYIYTVHHPTILNLLCTSLLSHNLEELPLGHVFWAIDP
jgi:hypothetical protein